MAEILIYGDSNTYGTMPMATLDDKGRFARGQRWPDVMADALGPDHHVLAEGLPGRTTVHDDPVEGGKRSGIDVLPAVLMSHTPLDLLVILLGTNDLKTRFSVTALELAHSVRRLVTEARVYVPDLDVMLLAPIPVIETGSLVEVFAGAETRQAGLTGKLEAIARDNACGFVDLGKIGRVSPVDGVHWSAETHADVGRAMAQEVTQYLEAKDA